MSRTAIPTLLMLCLGCPGSVGWAGQAQSEPGGTVPVRVPRTLAGRPDFQGVWTFATLTPLERPRELADKPFFTDAAAAEFVRRQLAAANADSRATSDYNEFWFERPGSVVRLNGRNLTSRITDPADGRVPSLTAAAQQRVAAVQNSRREHPADAPTTRTRSERCLSPTPFGFEPAGGGTNNFVQFAQTSDHLVILAELMGTRRIIPINAGKHLAPSIRSQFGDSRAHWEADSLVIDTTNFTGQFDFSFLGADENLHVTERLRFIDADTLLHEAIIDDSTAFTNTWTLVLPMFRVRTAIFEFACHEGNYALRNILSGARAEEAALKERAIH